MADTVIGVPDPSDASSAPGDDGSTSTTTGHADGKVSDEGAPGSNGLAADAMVASTTTVSIPAGPPKQPRRLKPAETALVTVWLLALTGAMVIALLSLWPLAEQVQLAAQGATTSRTPTPEPPLLDLVIAHPRLTPGLSIIVIGMSSGVLGSLVHTFTWLNQSSRGPSLTPRHKTHRPHDVVWFITAPLQGGLLALLVISAVSAGLLTTGQTQATTVSLFTVVAVGGLTGLFSRRMTAKLAQLVNQVGPKNTTTTTISTAPGHTTTTTSTAPPHPGQDRDRPQTGVPPK